MGLLAFKRHDKEGNCQIHLWGRRWLSERACSWILIIAWMPRWTSILGPFDGQLHTQPPVASLLMTVIKGFAWMSTRVLQQQKWWETGLLTLSHKERKWRMVPAPLQERGPRLVLKWMEAFGSDRGFSPWLSPKRNLPLGETTDPGGRKNPIGRKNCPKSQAQFASAWSQVCFPVLAGYEPVPGNMFPVDADVKRTRHLQQGMRGGWLHRLQSNTSSLD